jgi:hypothetical protein
MMAITHRDTHIHPRVDPRAWLASDSRNEVSKASITSLYIGYRYTVKRYNPAASSPTGRRSKTRSGGVALLEGDLGDAPLAPGVTDADHAGQVASHAAGPVPDCPGRHLK